MGEILAHIDMGNGPTRALVVAEANKQRPPFYDAGGSEGVQEQYTVAYTRHLVSIDQWTRDTLHKKFYSTQAVQEQRTRDREEARRYRDAENARREAARRERMMMASSGMGGMGGSEWLEY